MSVYELQIDGFVDLDAPGGTVARCLETLQMDDFELSALLTGTDRKDWNDTLAQLVRQAGPRRLDLRLALVTAVMQARELGAGIRFFNEQVLSVFPQAVLLMFVYGQTKYRSSGRLFIVQVPAATQLEFDRKVARHVEKIVFNQKSGSRLVGQKASFPSGHILVNQHSAQGFEARDGRYRLDWVVDGVPYQFYCHFKPDTDLVVFCQDALTRASVTLPVFFRWRWSEEIPASVMVLNDPTLYCHDSLNAGWMAGTRTRDYVEEMAGLIQQIAQQRGHRRVIFVGASAGGFAALALGSCVPGSQVLVDIPQTNLARYHVRAEVDAVARHALDFPSIEQVSPEYQYRIDVLERFEKNRRVPDIHFCQNLMDYSHNQSQCLYLLDRLLKKKVTDFEFMGQIVLDTYRRWHLSKGGHFPMSKRHLLQRLNRLLQKSPEQAGLQAIFPELAQWAGGAHD